MVISLWRASYRAQEFMLSATFISLFSLLAAPSCSAAAATTTTPATRPRGTDSDSLGDVTTRITLIAYADAARNSANHSAAPCAMMVKSMTP
jgi:hypothetical protein